jgi:hypothetical protein
MTEGGRLCNRPEALELERVHARSMAALREFHEEALSEMKAEFQAEQVLAYSHPLLGSLVCSPVLKCLSP